SHAWPAWQARGARPAHAAGGGVLPRHRRGLLHHEGACGGDREPRRGAGPLPRLRPDHHLAGPVDAGAVARPAARPGWTSGRAYLKVSITCTMAGPISTMKSAGRMNTIIGTVMIAGRRAAFSSAFIMRSSRNSAASTRSEWASGVP